MPNDTQSRKYLLTLNNPADKGLDHKAIKTMLAQLKSLDYYCMADEIGLDTETPHTHVYVQLRSPTRFSRIKRLFPEAHIDQARGSALENRDYVAKQGKWASDSKANSSVPGTFEESGPPPEEPGQGFRSDIVEIYHKIEAGYNNAQIMADNPGTAAHIGKMDKIRQDVLEAKYRDTFRQLDVILISHKK